MIYRFSRFAQNDNQHFNDSQRISDNQRINDSQYNYDNQHNDRAVKIMVA